MKQWYAVYTKSGWERKVIQLLYKKKIEQYCPLNKKVYQRGERRMTVEEPLFKSYVFVNIAEDEKAVVRQTEGVISFVHRADQPAVIKTEEIATMQEFLQAHQNVLLERISFKLIDNLSSAVLEEQHQGINPAVDKSLFSSLGYMLVAKPNTEEAVTVTAPFTTYFKKPFYYYAAAR